MAYTEETARNLVTESARKLLRTGLVARTWGNLSARISATQFVITPSGMGYGDGEYRGLFLRRSPETVQ